MAGTPRSRSRTPAPVARRAASRAGDHAGPPVWQLFAGLALATLIAYQPAWHGGRLWDDSAHLTNTALETWSGLYRIWFHFGATQQYYPVVHSAFWLMQATWGDDPLGYHVLNILLHAATATMIAVLLRRIGVPGAVLAAVLFALHPVEVESVAWMTELKNTLSGCFGLGAALLYLKFDASRAWRTYGLATALFLLALFSKTVTATLPAALLVVLWWKRGRLRWREDLGPLVPWLAIGAAAGALTAWVERTYVGAEGADFQLTLLERVIVAGHAVVFYLGKLIWPVPLMFMYPRWTIDAGHVAQYGFPLLVLAVVVALWLWHGRSRAPLAVALLFIGLLAPALGFVSVYPFLYTFVADHFQYLASIPILAAMAAGVTWLADRWRVPHAALVVVFGGALGWQTWTYSHQYADAVTLYRATLARNQTCWLCDNNLGVIEQERAQPDLKAAERDFTEAIRLHPSTARTHNNLGLVLQKEGRWTEARDQYAEAVRLNPKDPEAHVNLAAARLTLHDADGALEEFHAALRISPSYGEAHNDLGRALEQLGRLDEAAAEYREAARDLPGVALPFYNLGGVLMRQGRLDEALAQYRAAIRVQPDDARAHNNLGSILRQQGHVAEAVDEFRLTVRLLPQSGLAHRNLGSALQDLGRLNDALAEYREAANDPSAVNADLFADIGTTLVGLGQMREAAQAFQAALQLQPDMARARAGLAQARGGR
jgi:tetratricopeptide (TPR) repeat protein